MLRNVAHGKNLTYIPNGDSKEKEQFNYFNNYFSFVWAYFTPLGSGAS